jgi:predicted transcriptional regulator
MSRNFLVIDPEQRPDVLRALGSPQRVRILRLLHNRPGINVNDVAGALALPQSTVSSNLQILEDAALIRTEAQKGKKGQQKLCFLAFDDVLVVFRDDPNGAQANVIEVANRVVVPLRL